MLQAAAQLPWVVTAIWLALSLPMAWAARGVLEGDTGVDLYVNGYFVFSDPIMPVLLMNTERRFNVEDQGAWPVALQEPLSPGDVIALKGYTTRPDVVPITLPTLVVVPYAGLGGVIAAFDDGTITNSDWRCIESVSEEDQEKWYKVDYNDTHWPQAIEQPRACCPWRDQAHKWKRYSARWISPPRHNASGPRSFFCRYRLPNRTTSLMDGSEVMASSSLDDAVAISKFQVARAHTVIFLDLARPLSVSCGLIDTRFQLRPPSPVELQNFGTTALLTPGVVTWEDVTGLNMYQVYDLPVLAESDEANSGACRAKCSKHVNCTAMSYREEGASVAYKNCRLFAAFDAARLVDPPSPTWKYQHMEQQVEEPQLALRDTLLNLGTLYNAYCMAADPGTGYHSTWSALTATVQTARTKGCFNCGGLGVPEVQLLGGFAANNSITTIVRSSMAGRVLCAAQRSQSNLPPMTTEDVIAVGSFQLIIVDNADVPILLTGLAVDTEYDVSCVAEGESGEASTEDNLQKTRRRWRTEIRPTTIVTLVLRHLPARKELVIETSTRVDRQGWIWCQVYNDSHVQEHGVPTGLILSREGFRQEIEDTRVYAMGMFPGLNPAIKHEVYCTARFIDLAAMRANETFMMMQTGGPKARIVRADVQYDEVRLKVLVQYGPARVFCQAQRWSVRPNSARPPVPGVMRMRGSLFKENVDTENQAIIAITVAGLATGSWHDLYCYAEELLPEPPPGAEPPPPLGMTPDDMRKRRVLVRTPGPEFKEEGWRCVAGAPCGISGLRGRGLSPFDQVLARSKSCPGRCLCNGIEDVDHKGAVCSAVSHSRSVRQPDPSNDSFVDVEDPRGKWCYVNPGVCADEERSSTFPSLFLSYFACLFDELAVRAGAEPSGFLNEGLATQVPAADALNGTNFSWGELPLFVPGAAYHLCWCNGTTSSCRYERDFRLRIGLLHVAGPTAKQLQTQMRCLAGLPCTVEHFSGHAVTAGNRLAVLPATQLGCAWEKAYPSAPPGLVGFPQLGLSMPAVDSGRIISWGSQPVMALGGIHLLCWCGAQTHSGAPACPSERPDGGRGFLAPAGQLQVVGPSSVRKQICLIGVDCVMEDVDGSGLQGGDRVAVLQACGQASPAPVNWTAGAEGIVATQVQPGWVQGGWLTYVPSALVQTTTVVPSEDPLSVAVLSNPTPALTPVPPAPVEAFASLGPFTNLSVHRGVWGFANHGMSVPLQQAGMYAWQAPSLAIPGVYALCWCPGDAECDEPEKYQMFLGELRLRGPTVLPSVSQAFKCIRGRACNIKGLAGFEIMPGTKLLVTSVPCGGVASVGMPSDGVSLPSSDGSSFSWGPEATDAVPGKHRLCWCAGLCFTSSDFATFAGVLRVKAPFFRPRRFFCALGELDCYIGIIDGEGLSQGDSVMTMAGCGEGDPSSSFSGGAVSVYTGQDGSWFRLPAARAAGISRVCWCPAENLCVHGSDFYTDIGILVVGGPEAYATYICYDWQPCEIASLVGTGGALSDGDRLWVVPPGAACGNGDNLTRTDGFPYEGLALPATDGGLRHSWGPEKVRAGAGMYLLCFCSRRLAPGGICNESAPFVLRAGVLKVGTAKEYMYANRPPDPEPRSNDASLALMLAIILPTLLLAGLVFARMKLGKNGGPAAATPFSKEPTLWEQEKMAAKARHGFREVAVIRTIVTNKFKGVTRPEQSVKLEDIGDRDFFDDKASAQSSPKSSPKSAMRKGKTSMGMLEDASPAKKSLMIADSPETLNSLPWEVPQDPASDQSPSSGSAAGLALALQGSERRRSSTSSALQLMKSAASGLWDAEPTKDELHKQLRAAYTTRKTLSVEEMQELGRVSKRSSGRSELSEPTPPTEPPPRLLGTSSRPTRPQSATSHRSSQSDDSFGSGPPPPPPDLTTKQPLPPAWTPPSIPRDTRLRQILELDYGLPAMRINPHRASSKFDWNS